MLRYLLLAATCAVGTAVPLTSAATPTATAAAVVTPLLAVQPAVVTVWATSTVDETVTSVETITSTIYTSTVLATQTLTAGSSSSTLVPTLTDSADIVNVSLSALGITQFLGTNTGIASWFRTDNSGDSTNGHSWCSFPYNDSLPLFAPSVGTMLGNFGNDYSAAGTAYCGLEAYFVTPSGRTALFYIGDGFDDKWVLTPGSIDVVTGVFPELLGTQTTNKDDVVQGVQWSFTGRRDNRFAFNGLGDGSG